MADELIEKAGETAEEPKKTLGFKAGFAAAMTVVTLSGTALSPVIVDGIYESEKAKLEVKAIRDTLDNAKSVRDHQIMRYTFSEPDSITGEYDTLSALPATIQIADPIIGKNSVEISVLGGRKYKTTFSDMETDSVIFIGVSESALPGRAVIKTQIFPRNEE